MKKNGFAFIYVLIIAIPAALLALQVVDLTLMDYKINNNTIYLQQAYYFAELGVEHGSYRLNQASISLAKNENYYLYFSGLTVNSSASKPQGNSYAYVKINVSEKQGKKVFTIESEGYYFGSVQNLSAELIKDQ